MDNAAARAQHTPTVETDAAASGLPFMSAPLLFSPMPCSLAAAQALTVQETKGEPRQFSKTEQRRWSAGGVANSVPY